MKRVGNAQTIADIEFLIDPPGLSERRHSWTAWGVNCTRDLHRYSGQAYEFNIEVVDLRHSKAGGIAWHDPNRHRMVESGRRTKRDAQ